MPDSFDQSDVYPADRSLVEVLAELAGDGFDGNVVVDDADGSCTCAACGTRSSPHEMHFAQRRRIEGASDPGEMANVLALTCPACGSRGVAVCRFGPEASEGDTILMQAARGHLDPD